MRAHYSQRSWTPVYDAKCAYKHSCAWTDADTERSQCCALLSNEVDFTNMDDYLAEADVYAIWMLLSELEFVIPHYKALLSFRGAVSHLCSLLYSR